MGLRNQPPETAERRGKQTETEIERDLPFLHWILFVI